jgi:pantetheine-phosphate adenylyltransferase
VARPHAKSKAVYAGSFDPLSIGHLWMIEQGVRLFGKLTVAIGVNPHKRCSFSLEDRLAMLRASIRDLPGIHIATFGQQFLIDYAHSVGAQFILRGIRNETDYEYERVMRNINGDLSAEITTVFLMPPRDIAEVSSSMVKGLIGPRGWQKVVKPYVPAAVYAHLLRLYDGRPPEALLV